MLHVCVFVESSPLRELKTHLSHSARSSLVGSWIHIYRENKKKKKKTEQNTKRKRKVLGCGRNFVTVGETPLQHRVRLWTYLHWTMPIGGCQIAKGRTRLGYVRPRSNTSFGICLWTERRLENSYRIVSIWFGSFWIGSVGDSYFGVSVGLFYGFKRAINA